MSRVQCPARTVAAGIFALVLGTLCACRKPVASADVEYREATRQLRLGNLTQALAGAERGCQEWSDRPESPEYWRFRLLKAEALIAHGSAKEAWSWLETSPPNRPEFREFRAETLMNRGYAKYLFAEYAEARKLLDEAYGLLGPETSSTLTAQIELRRGSVLTRLGEGAGAERSFRRALGIATNNHDEYMEAAARGNLGFQMMQESRCDEAIPWFEKVLVLSEKLESKTLIARTLGNLGRCYYVLGDLDRAIKLQSQAVALAKETGDGHRLQIWLGNLGDAYYRQRDYAKAISYFHQALEISRGLGATYSTTEWLRDMTSALLESGDVAAAKRSNREAFALSQKDQTPGNLAWAWLITADIAKAEADITGAEKAYSEVLPIASRSAQEEGVWEAHAGLAWVRTAQGRWKEAETEYRTALATLERTRERLAREEWKLSFHSSSMRFYQEYVGFLVDRGQTEKALEVAESSRARVLAAKLGVLESAPPMVAAGRYREMAAKLDAVLVSIWLAPQQSFAWVVTPKKIEQVVLPGEAEINRLAEAYRGAIQGLRDPLETANPAGLRLSELVLAPIARLVAPGSKVILVPDGALHEVNLEALPVGSGKPHYWLEDVTLSIVPSLALLETGSRSRSADSLLLIGNPVPPGNEYPPLPDAEKEVEGLRRRFSGPESLVLAGAAAEPGAYRGANPGRFSLIHFSAHATANSESPLDSAVILSRKGEAYKLYAREVIGVPLKSRLVTISACRGAGARVYSGEGLVGFAWAFLQAGAHNVVAGLWEVNDRSTAILMDRLYAEMAAGRAPAAALRAAKLDLLKSAGAYRKPYYWAPFQVFTRSPGV